jgi:CO/xanthine dehydrogenase Mo-binding subunit
MDTLEDFTLRHSGKPLSRKEDFRLLTGQGRYADDFSVAGQVFAAFVRSPHLSSTNPLGIRSAGQGPTTAASAAVINAIVDALTPLGVTDISLPALPNTVWRGIEAAKGRQKK